MNFPIILHIEDLFAVAQKGITNDHVLCLIALFIDIKVKCGGKIIIIVLIENIFNHHVAEIGAVSTLRPSLLGGKDIVHVIFGIDVAKIAIFQGDVGNYENTRSFLKTVGVFNILFLC